MFRRNPVYQREIGNEAKTGRIFLMIIIFNCVLSIVTFVMFFTTFNGVSNMGAVDYNSLTELYTVMAYIEFGMVMLIIPATTAGTITGERERKTLDIMLAGGRHAGTIIWGKFLSNVRFVIVIMLSSIPVLSMVFIYGGVRFSNLIQLLIVIVIAGMYIGSIGILCSCICKRTTSAIVMSYGMFVMLTLATIAFGYLVVKVKAENTVINDYFPLLFNPVAPLTYLIGSQLDNIDGFMKLVFYDISEECFKAGMSGWIWCGVLIQLIISVILLSLSSLILNPLKFNYVRRFLMRKDNEQNG